MFPHGRVRPAALRAAALIAALGAALLASGCAETAKPVAAGAADPQARVAPVGYRPVLGTYRGARPVEPAPWTGAPKKEGER